MIIGIGTDLLKMSGIPGAVLAPGDPFYEKIFTEEEKRQAASSQDPENWLRRRFAGKEAVFKALGEDPDRARICEIEILDDMHGAPRAALHGSLEERAKARGIGKIHISLSSDGDYALAFATAEGRDRSRTEKG